MTEAQAHFGWRRAALLAVLLAGVITLLTTRPSGAESTPSGAPAQKGVTVRGPRRFLIRDVKGSILVWEPWASQWTPIASGTKVWENSLVQIGHDATFSFELDSGGRSAGLQADAVQVTLNAPIVVRLEEDIMRKVKLSTYFIPKVPPEKAKETDAASLMYKSMNEAWERFSAMMVQQGIDVSWLKPIDPGPENGVSVQSKLIKLVSPPDGFTAVVDKLPSEIRVTWELVRDPSAQYELRMWPFDKPRPKDAMALTDLDFHNVKLTREGSFFIQIATTDGKWQSKVHRLFVALPLAGRMTKKNLAAGIAALPIPLTLPPRNFTYRVGKYPAWVTFSWDTMAQVESGQTFEVVVADTKNKPLLRKNVRERAFQLKFNQPGEYRWWVEADLPPLPGEPNVRHVTSETRAFRLIASTSDPIGEMLLARASGVLYLEDLQ